jgi:hypothetical protein
VFLSGTVVSGSDLVFIGGWKASYPFPTWLVDGWVLFGGDGGAAFLFLLALVGECDGLVGLL